MNRKIKNFGALAASLLVIAVGFVALNRGVTVTVKNVSAEALRSVVVQVTGNAYPLGDIAAGEYKSVRVFPTGESRLEIEHADGLLIVDTYFESGYRGAISVEVTANKVKRVEGDLAVDVIFYLAD